MATGLKKPVRACDAIGSFERFGIVMIVTGLFTLVLMVIRIGL